MSTPFAITKIHFINFLYFVFGLLFISTLLTAVFLFINLVYYVFNINELMDLKNPFVAQVYLVDSVSDGILNWSQEESAPFELISKVGYMQTSRVPGRFLVLNHFLFLVMCGAVMFSIKFALQILNEVKSGAFLLVENTLRFRWIVLLNVFAFLVYKLSGIINSYYFSQRIAGEEGLSFGINRLSFEGVGAIFWAIFLIIIAEVFRIGAAIKAENDLTI